MQYFNPEQGNIEFLISTPLQPFEWMLGKIIPYVLVGFVQIAIILRDADNFSLQSDALALLAITAVGVLIASSRFSKRLN